jgi:uncharacterized membrane protein YraQ (UPF0718 family)
MPIATIGSALADALHFAFSMTWEILWALVLGFALSAAVQAVVSKSEMARLLPDGSPSTLGIACGLGAASSSCSYAAVALAAVLWHGGISFGGVASFIFADLIVLPILNIYRKYYGIKVSAFLLATFYAAMVLAGYAVEILFSVFGLIPERHLGHVSMESGVTLNYTTVLNVLFLFLASALVARAIRTGVVPMLKMMNEPEDHHHGHEM